MRPALPKAAVVAIFAALGVGLGVYLVGGMAGISRPPSVERRDVKTGAAATSAALMLDRSKWVAGCVVGRAGVGASEEQMWEASLLCASETYRRLRIGGVELAGLPPSEWLARGAAAERLHGAYDCSLNTKPGSDKCGLEFWEPLLNAASKGSGG